MVKSLIKKNKGSVYSVVSTPEGKKQNITKTLQDKYQTCGIFGMQKILLSDVT